MDPTTAILAALLASTESWEQELLKGPDWSVLTPVETNVVGESQLKRLDDGSLKSTGTPAATERSFGSDAARTRSRSG